MASQLEIIVAIRQMGAQALDKVNTGFMKLESQMKKLNKLQNVIGGAAVVGAASVFVNAYEESRRATMRLNQALENVGDTYKAHEQDILATTQALQKKTNFGDDEQIAALAELIPLVGNYSAAMKTLPDILNLAAFTQEKDLNAATQTYAQLLNGEVPKALAKTMPELKKLQESGATVAEKMALVNEKIKGFAEADMSPLVVMKNALGDQAEIIGEKLLPVFKGFMEAFVNAPGVVKALVVALPPLILMLGTLGGPLTLVAVGLVGVSLAVGKMVDKFKQSKAEIENFDKSMKEAYETAKYGTTLEKDFEDSGKRMSEAFFGGFTANISKEDYAKLPANVKDQIDSYVTMNKKKEPTAKGKSKTLKHDLFGEYFGIDTGVSGPMDKIEDHAKELDKIRQDISENWSKTIQDNAEREYQIIEETYEKYKTKMESFAEFGQSLGTAMASGIGKGAEGVKESLKNTLNTTISFFEKMAQTAFAAAYFWNPPALIAGLTAITLGFEGLKNGISSFAGGTPFAGGGMAVVGEDGPELVNLARGSQVYNNSQTRNMITNNKPVVVVVNGGGNMRKQLERATRDKSINWNQILAMGGVNV